MIDYFKNIVDRTFGATERVKPPAFRLYFPENYSDRLHTHTDGMEQSESGIESNYTKPTPRSKVEQHAIDDSGKKQPEADKLKSSKKKNNLHPERSSSSYSQEDPFPLQNNDPLLPLIIPEDPTGNNKLPVNELVKEENSIPQQQQFNHIVNRHNTIRNERHVDNTVLNKHYHTSLIQNRKEIIETDKDSEILKQSVIQQSAAKTKNKKTGHSPDITISIGTIEIKPKQPVFKSKEKKQTQKYTPSLSLDTYLKNTSGRIS